MLKMITNLDEFKTAVLNKDQTAHWRVRKLIEDYLENKKNPIPEREVTVAKTWLFETMKLKAQGGEASGQCWLGHCYYYGYGTQKNYPEAVKWYRKAAEQGYVPGQNGLGLCYENEFGVNKDVKKAEHWYQKAADQDYAPGQYNLGRCYGNGFGVSKDSKKTVDWYQKAAEQGYSSGQHGLGWCYENGFGVSKDHKKAVYWYQKAAEQGDADAQCTLGWSYLKGEGVTENHSTAVYFFKKAIEQDHALAFNNLGLCYENGYYVTQNVSQAIYYYIHAEQRGETNYAPKNLERLAQKGYTQEISYQRLRIENEQMEKARLALEAENQSLRKQALSAKEEELSVSSLTLLPKLKVAYELPFSDLSDKSSWKRLGSGGFGEVFLAKYQYNAVAIKALLSHQLSAEGTEEFKREITLMADLRHPQVVQFYGASIQGQQYYLVMEYMPKGSLYQILHDKSLDNTAFHWSLRFQIALDVGKGLMYLHNKEILHRDLKSLNVLLGANYEAKLTDFGLAKVKSETASTTKNSSVVGSVLWLAPELFQRRAQHTKASDMYSYGMVLWEIASRKNPWEDAANPSIVPTWVLQGERETLPVETPIKMAEVIRYCWFGEAQKRLNAAQAVERLSSVQESSQGVEQHVQAPKQENSFLGNLSSKGQSRPF